jgi:hypothetical protein
VERIEEVVHLIDGGPRSMDGVDEGVNMRLLQRQNPVLGPPMEDGLREVAVRGVGQGFLRRASAACWWRFSIKNLS